MTSIFEKLGFNRDSIALLWMKWIGYATSAVLFLASYGSGVTEFGIPASWVKPIALVAAFIAMESAQHRTSDLPGKHDQDLIVPPTAAATPQPKQPPPPAVPFISSVVFIVCVLGAQMASAQVGTEPLAWAPGNRPVADALGTAAVAGQGLGASVTAWKSWRAGDHRPAYRSGCSIALAMGVATGLKAVVHEERPNGVDNQSFPSGHSAAAAALSGWNFTFGVPIAAFVGISRANANWHHLWKDVLPGEAIGAGAQAACSALIR